MCMCVREIKVYVQRLSSTVTWKLDSSPPYPGFESYPFSYYMYIKKKEIKAHALQVRVRSSGIE